MAHTTALAHRVGLAREALAGRIALRAALDTALALPRLADLCGSSPTVPARWAGSLGEGGRIEIRWRPVGRGILLSELDVAMASGVRARALLWSVVSPETGEIPRSLCPDASLPPVPLGGVLPRPGE